MAALIRGWFATSILAALLLTTGPAAAEKSRADILFQKGRAAAVAGDYLAARSKFIESQRLDPAVGTLLNIADCEEHLAHRAAALTAFRSALPQLDPNDARYAITKERVAALEKRTARLTVSLAAGAPPKTRALLDGALLSPAELGVPIIVEPGSHVVTMQVDGGGEQATNIALGEGQSERIVLDPAHRPAVPDGRVAANEPRSPLLVPPVVAFGVGAAGLALVGISWAQMSSSQRTIDRACDATTRLCSGAQTETALDARDAGRTWSALNYVGWGVGLAGLGAGAFLLLTGGTQRARSVSMAASPLLGGANVGAAGHF